MAEHDPFWLHTPLNELSDEQWESLCDGCGRCCLQKLEDTDTGDLHFTDVACRMLDHATCRCSDYANRFAHVEDCLSLRPLTQQIIEWLPKSCAYRRIALGEGLADWHPLVSGDPQSVKNAGISIAGRCVAEEAVPVHELPYHVVSWKDC